MLIQSEALLLVLKLVLGQILVCCCGGTTSPHGHTLFQFGRTIFQNRLAGINKPDWRGQGQVCTHGLDIREKREAAMPQYGHGDVFILIRASRLENPKFAQGVCRAFM